MKHSRFPNLLVCLTVMACHALGGAPEVQEPAHHTRSLLFFPKPFSIFTMPRPEKDGDTPHHGKRPDGGIVSHVLHGGGIGIEIRPLAPLQGILAHAKKILPGGHQRGTVGQPSHERPPEEPSTDHHERPHPPRRPGYGRPPHRPEYERPHQQRPNYERPNYQRPDYDKDRPDHEVRPPKDHEIVGHEGGRPPKPPKKEEDHEEISKDPDWEDIGEGVPEDYGEGVLQPRGRRPKRFLDSKIYHVPLKYISNGRTHRVRRIRNGIVHSPKHA